MRFSLKALSRYGFYYTRKGIGLECSNTNVYSGSIEKGMIIK